MVGTVGNLIEMGGSIAFVCSGGNASLLHLSTCRKLRRACGRGLCHHYGKQIFAHVTYSPPFSSPEPTTTPIAGHVIFVCGDRLVPAPDIPSPPRNRECGEPLGWIQKHAEDKVDDSHRVHLRRDILHRVVCQSYFMGSE